MTLSKHIVTDRDRAIMATLTLTRAMTADQIARCFYGGASSLCRTRLLFLAEQKKHIKRFRLQTLYHGTRAPYVYTTKSERLTSTQWYLPHLLDIAEVYVRFSLSAKHYGYSLDGWMNDLVLKKTHTIVVPDATFQILTSERPYRFLVEVDKGTETLEVIAEKFINYRKYFMSDYEQLFGTDRGRVLVIAPTQTRLENLKQVCEEVGGRNRYWFALLSTLTDPLNTVIWKQAGKTEVFPLI